MGRQLNRDDIVTILTGATFLGAGGGGSLKMGMDLIELLEREEIAVTIELIGLEEAADHSYAAMVAGLGSPAKMTGGTFGPDALYAYEAYKKALQLEGKEVKYLYSGELGGFNTFVPMMVAIRNNISGGTKIQFLDVDGNGRAVPELNTSLNSARGFPANPIGMGSIKEDRIISYSTSSENAESIARTLCIQFGYQIGFSTWGMSKDELKANAVVGALTLCEQVGIALTKAAQELISPFEALQAVGFKSRRAMRGKITQIKIESVGGFDIGKTTIHDEISDQDYIIHFQNENICVRDEQGTLYITVPELISMVTTECNSIGERKCSPLTNADAMEGMHVEVILSPAHEYWWANDKKAYKCWLPVMERVGLKDFKKFE